MILNDDDIKILEIIYNSKNKESNLLKITEELFDRVSKQILRAKRKFVEYRLKRMIPDILIRLNNKKITTYKILLKKQKEISFDDCDFADGRKGRALSIKVEGKWSIFEI